MLKNLCLATIAVSLVLSAPVLGAIGGNVQAKNPNELVPLQPVRNQFCRALTPAGWTVIDQDDRGTTFSVASPDRSAIATYGIVGVNRGQVAGAYGPQYRTPALLAQFLAASVVGAKTVTVTGMRAFNGMQVMNFAGGNKRGVAIYRIYPLPSDPGGYVISVRIATGASAGEVSTGGAVAASIDCKTAFKAPRGGYAEVHAKSAETGISQRCKTGDCSDADLAGTYNSQLGTGYVHSESGTNYLVDPANDYRETGPEGPGYYRQAGNTLEKLLPGRAD